MDGVHEKLMNEEDEWDHRILAAVREGPADCIRLDEVAAALKKMKRHKAPVLSGLLAEMIQSTGDIGTQWILDLFNAIVKEGCIPEDKKSSVVLPVYKGVPIECESSTHTHTTYNHFTALLEFVRDYPGEQVPER